MNIIGVDHIQFAYPDVIASAGDLTRAGYELDFVERFSLLILSEEQGAVVREAKPPKR